MPNDNQAQALVNQYLELQNQQDKIEKELEGLKKVIAKYCQETNQHKLKSGKTLLKVKQFSKTIFPKVEQRGREEVEEIMRRSKEWKQAITFDIVKLGLAYDKKKLSTDLLKKLKPYTDKDEVIRITKSKIKTKNGQKKSKA